MALVNGVEFSRIAGWGTKHTSALKSAGRLVMKGKLIDVDASLARVAETSHPSYAKNAGRRTAEQRPVETHSADIIPESYQRSKAIKALFDSKLTRLEYERAVGDVVAVHDVEKNLATAVTTFRSRLEGLPAKLGIQLAAENSEDRCIALLAEEVERCLGELQSAFTRVVR